MCANRGVQNRWFFFPPVGFSPKKKWSDKKTFQQHLGVSKNRGGPPKSSILIGFSLINHPFWGTTIFGNTHLRSVVFQLFLYT